MRHRPIGIGVRASPTPSSSLGYLTKEMLLDSSTRTSSRRSTTAPWRRASIQLAKEQGTVRDV